MKRGKCIESLEISIFRVTEAVGTANCVKKIALCDSGESLSASAAIYAGDGEMPMGGGFLDGRRSAAATEAMLRLRTAIGKKLALA